MAWRAKTDLIETALRDGDRILVTRTSRSAHPHYSLRDGGMEVTEPQFRALAGRLEMDDPGLLPGSAQTFKLIGG